LVRAASAGSRQHESLANPLRHSLAAEPRPER
jgi:hypothetical protein